MGGILQVPKAPRVSAPPLQPSRETPVDNAQARINEIERQRRGRSGTVQTSDRGLVRLNARAPQKKSLLGE